MRRWSLILVFLLAGCAPKETSPAASSNIPQKIISVVPSATETLFAIGAGSRVVAIGDYDVLPAGEQARPRIGGLLNPNIEKIIELRPELVIVYGTQDVLRTRLASLGIRLEPFAHGNVSETLRYMRRLGGLVGNNVQADALVQKIESTFERLRKDRPAAHPTVLLVHSRGAGMISGFYSVGKPAFQNELIEIAGGSNVFGDVDKEVIQPSVEEVIARSPDVIVETMPAPLSAEEAERRTRDWDRLDKVPAVMNHQVYVVGEDFMLVPGPRLDDAALLFAELIRGRRP